MMGLFLCICVSASSAKALNENIKQKPWTFLVYLNGDNNLDSYGTKDIEEMMRVGSDANINVVVLRDTADQKESTKILYIEKGHTSVVYDYGKNIDMGDWQNLVGFYRFAHEHYPSEHTAIDVWNHGSGWDFKFRKEPTKGISYDDGSGNHITTQQLGQALREIQSINNGVKLDILGMDACLMQMAEVVYEVADSTQLVTASEEVIPASGWAYDGFLSKLSANPQMPASELAYWIQKSYYDFYKQAGDTSAQGSVVDTALFVKATGSLNLFITELVGRLPLYYSETTEILNQVQHYSTPSYKDLIALILSLRDKIKEESLTRLADQAVTEIRASVLSNFVLGDNLQGSNGISIWAPDQYSYSGELKDLYEGLAWSRASIWKTFLEIYARPTTPLVSITSADVKDPTGMGFINAGKDLTYTLMIENGSKIEAKAVGVKLELPHGFSLKSGPSQFDLTQDKQMKATLSFVIRADASLAPGPYEIEVQFDVPSVGHLSRKLTLTLERIYKVEKKKVSTPHNYDGAEFLEWTITKQGASEIRVHFSKFITEHNYDFVYLYDKNNNIVKVYEGEIAPFWSEPVPGDSVKIRFTSDDSNNFYGFDIDKIAY